MWAHTHRNPFRERSRWILWRYIYQFCFVCDTHYDGGDYDDDDGDNGDDDEDDDDDDDGDDDDDDIDDDDT